MGAWAALLGTERTDEEVAALRASKVEFRDDAYLRARRVFGGPAFVHGVRDPSTAGAECAGR